MNSRRRAAACDESVLCARRRRRCVFQLLPTLLLGDDNNLAAVRSVFVFHVLKPLQRGEMCLSLQQLRPLQPWRHERLTKDDSGRCAGRQPRTAFITTAAVGCSSSAVRDEPIHGQLHVPVGLHERLRSSERRLSAPTGFRGRVLATKQPSGMRVARASLLFFSSKPIATSDARSSSSLVMSSSAAPSPPDSMPRHAGAPRLRDCRTGRLLLRARHTHTHRAPVIAVGREPKLSNRHAAACILLLPQESAPLLRVAVLPEDGPERRLVLVRQPVRLVVRVHRHAGPPGG